MANGAHSATRCLRGPHRRAQRRHRPGDNAATAPAFDTFSAVRAREAVGVERDQTEAIAGTVAAQAFTRADLEPLATKAELRTLQWVVGIQSAITLATFAIVAAKLL